LSPFALSCPPAALRLRFAAKMPLRNPFKRVSVVQVPEPVSVDAGFRDADLVGSKPVDPEPTIEYQLSGTPPSLHRSGTNVVALEINDSGVFLPVW
jgi:hypothetical protein